MRVAIGIVVFAAVAAAQQGGSVAGSVTTPDGAPVRKAEVLLRASRVMGARGQIPDNYLTHTDGNGRFAVEGVVPGSYECVPSRVGFEARPPDRFATTNYFPQITVAAGQRVTGVALKLTPLGTISGRVVDPEGFPVSHVEVAAMQYVYNSGNKTLRAVRQVESDDRGQFRIYDLYPGEYFVRATARRSGGMVAQSEGPKPDAFLVTYYAGVTDPTRAKPIQVPAGGEAASTDVYLQRQALFSIRGHLPAAEPGKPIIRNLTIRKHPADPNLRAYNVLINGEKFEIGGLVSGSYVVSFQRPDPERPGENLTARAFVDVLDHDVESVEPVFGAAMEVTGTVKMIGPARLPLEQLRVSLQMVDGANAVGGPVKADGTFTVARVEPELYQVRVLPVAAAYPTSIKLGNSELSKGQLDLRDGRSASLNITVSGEMGIVTGTVFDDKGNPAPTINVTLVPDQDIADWQSRWRNVLTDSQGRFNFRGVVPGHYVAFGWKDVQRGAPMDAAFRKPFEKLGFEFTIEPGDKKALSLKQIDPQKK